MPSYRSILVIGSMRPGARPEAIEAAARAAVAQSTTLEAFQVDVMRGEPRVTVRFTASDDADAHPVHERIVTQVREQAAVPRAVLAKVVGGRSVPVY
ncbi:FMN-dependent dehydrogenase [Actinomyces bovis]|nr:FMN-dependent dehydrogenase [Actinomyces bovis]